MYCILNKKHLFENLQIHFIKSTLLFFFRYNAEVVLGLHDFDNFENGGQPEVFDIVRRIKVNVRIIICRSKSNVYRSWRNGYSNTTCSSCKLKKNALGSCFFRIMFL